MQGDQPEQAPTYSDILLFCHPRNVGNLVQAFEIQIAQAAGALPLAIIWSGTTSLLHQGMILLQCKGEPPAAFLQNLSIDSEIFDFAVSDWVQEEEQESAKEEGSRVSSAQEQQGGHSSNGAQKG